MEQTKYKNLFHKIIVQKHGMEINFESIEEKLKPLRNGAPLTYSHLEIIANPSYWPFNKYWMWPSKNKIKAQFKNTHGWFTNLPDKEEQIISNFDAIFKNIALVSILLRFVYPEHYAIYSRPPLKILQVERGANDTEEYLFYINEMRILKQSFKVSTTAEVDMIVWAIAQEKGEYLREFLEILAKCLPENLTPSQIIKYLSHNPLKIAEIYYRHGDYKTAGMWAGRAFEKFIYDECKKFRVFIHGWGEELFSIINRLCEINIYAKKRKTLHHLRLYRNRAMHVDHPFTKDNARNLIRILKNLIKSEK